jgi:hypothetical protein
MRILFAFAALTARNAFNLTGVSDDMATWVDGKRR